MIKDDVKKEEILEGEETKMENEEIEKVEDEEVNEESLQLTDETSIVEGFNTPSPSTATRKKIQTTITDPKVLFNLEEHVDFKLNDMEGKELTIVDVVIKTYEHDKEVVDEETGEIKNETERKMVTILIDDTNTSYVTASKLFAIRVIQLMQLYGNKVHEGIKIRITKSEHKGGNKKLGLELV